MSATAVELRRGFALLSFRRRRDALLCIDMPGLVLRQLEGQRETYHSDGHATPRTSTRIRRASRKATHLRFSRAAWARADAHRG